MIAPVPFRSRGLFEKRTTTGSRDAVPRLVAEANGSYSIFKLPEKGSGDR